MTGAGKSFQPASSVPVWPCRASFREIERGGCQVKNLDDLGLPTPDWVEILKDLPLTDLESLSLSILTDIPNLEELAAELPLLEELPDLADVWGSENAD